MNGTPPAARPFTEWAAYDTARSASRIPSASWAEELKRDPTAGRVEIVLDLRFAGIAMRLSSARWRSVGPSGEDRSPVPALVTIPQDIDETIQIGSAAAGGRRYSFSFRAGMVAANGGAVYQTVRNGLYLGGIAEIAFELIPREVPAAWVDRIVWMRGIVTSVSFGQAQAQPGSFSKGDEVVTVEIEDPREAVNCACPPWVIDGDDGRFVDVHQSAIGGRIPLALNQIYRAPAIRVTSGSPGGQIFVFAQGGGWSIDAVYVNGVAKSSGDATYGWSLRESTDVAGTAYSAVQFTNGATAWEDSDEVHVTAHAQKFMGPVETIRAVLDSSSALGTAGYSLRAFGESAGRMPPTTTEPPDNSLIRTGVYAPRIYANAGSGGSQAKALDYVEQSICDSYPMIQMLWTDGGYGPVVVDSRLPPVFALTAQQVPLVSIKGLAEVVPRDISTSFGLRYDYDPMNDIYGGISIRDSTDPQCAMMEQLLGYRVSSDTKESILIPDDPGGAEYIMDWRVAHFGSPSMVVEYEALGSFFFLCRAGDSVELTDDEMGFESVRGVIESRGWRKGYCRLRIRIWPKLQMARPSAGVPPSA